MLQVFSKIALTLTVAVAFQMTARAVGNAPIDRLPRLGAAIAFQESVPINRLPSAVTTAIKNRFPRSQMIWAEKDFDDGMLKYEVKIRSNGQHYDIDVSPSGKILKIDRDD
jgi:hypothetical protein